MTTATAPAEGTHGAGPMPELADYDAATTMLRDAHATIEDLRLRVEKHLESSPTLADVGSLWSFIEGLRLYVDMFADEVRELTETLRSLDAERLDLLAVSERPDAS